MISTHVGTPLAPLAFPDMAKARDWLKRHEKEVLVGSIVLVLVPLAAL